MYTNILLPVDMEHTDESARALEIAIEEAQRSKAKLTIMTVAPGFGSPLVASYFEKGAVKAALKEVARQLKQYIDDHIPDDLEIKAVVAEGNPAEKILQQGIVSKIDLVVLASHNSQIENLLLGSCASKVVRHSHCTVTVVK
jgi:nucleotide-binding universal stress UspA family protein